MNICVLGCTGMLGSAIINHLLPLCGKKGICATARLGSMSLAKSYFNNLTILPFDPLCDNMQHLPHAEYYISALGIIKPFMKKNISDAIFINSVFPHRLAALANLRAAKLIHITTDCVFSGKSGSYTEESLHDALDDYGKSKSLGEPSNCMVIRTSIIGEEIHKNASLIAWAKSQAGKEVNGFTNHFWNGITTKQYGKVVGQIINDGLFENGTNHVFANAVSKATLLKMLDSKFKLNLTVKDIPAPERIDRTLYSVKKLCTELKIPNIDSQIDNL